MKRESQLEVKKEGRGKEAHLEDGLEESLHTLREDGIPLRVGDEGGAGEEDVLDGLGGPAVERTSRRKGVGQVESCENPR